MNWFKKGRIFQIRSGFFGSGATFEIKKMDDKTCIGYCSHFKKRERYHINYLKHFYEPIKPKHQARWDKEILHAQD